MSTTALQRVLAALLAATAVLFVVGVTIEKSEDSGHDEGTEESVGSHVAFVSASSTSVPTHEDGESGEDGEKILGVSPESTGAVIAVVALSALLAAGVLWRPRRWLFVAVAMICVAFAIADVIEASEKFEAPESGIGAIASVVALGHIAAALISTRLAGRSATQPAT